MRVWAKTLHIYEDAATKREYRIPAGEWREVPDEIAAYIIAAHPEKLSVLGPEQDKPDEDQFPRGTYQIVEVTASPFNTEMKSPKRRGRPPGARGERVGR